MGSDPRVLVLAADDELVGDLSRGLDALGWRTLTARSLGAGAAAVGDLKLEAVLIDMRTFGDLDSVAETLKAAARPRRLPVIAIGGDEADPAADLFARRPPHPAQAAIRLEQLTRAAITDEEFALRQATFAAQGHALTATEADGGPLRVLVAGAADLRFLALSNALEASGAEIVAAPTPYTAFDYLHESAFDAAVLWAGEDPTPALSIASGMKRNTRLYHVPLTLYLRQSTEIDLGELYNRGFADVAAADTPEDETAARVLALARTHRRHQSVRRALEAARGSGLMDPSTGLFTRDLFASHLGRLAEGSRSRRRPLSVCVLRVADSEAIRKARAQGWLDRAMPQIGAMVSRLVRVEDTAARLASEIFALALPATPAPAARIAAERIAAVIGCTAFDGGPDQPPFVAEFQIGCAQLEPGEDPAAALERASRDLPGR